MTNTRLPEIIARHENELLAEWIRLQNETVMLARYRGLEDQLQANSQEFVRTFSNALAESSNADLAAPQWTSMRDLLGEFGRKRVAQGFSPSEIATFVFSFKKPLFQQIGADYGEDRQGLQNELWTATEILDRLGLYTIEAYQRTREEVILRQQQEMLELSTPVIELWTGVLGLPVIGTLDSSRAQVLMENLLEAVVEKGADLAIIDITGVPTVDTMVAHHLLKTVSAARLMGADCIISGIRPQIAQTIIHLGVDLVGVLTKATLADAFKLALKKKNLVVTNAK